MLVGLQSLDPARCVPRESYVFEKQLALAYQWRGVVNIALYSIQSLKRCLQQEASIAERVEVSGHIYHIPCATAMLYSIRPSGDQAGCWTIFSRLAAAVSTLRLPHQSSVCIKHVFWCNTMEAIQSRCTMIKTLQRGSGALLDISSMLMMKIRKL